MSQRVAKVESQLRHLVATAIKDLLGIESAYVTVTAIDASPDLRHAIVWAGVLGDNKRKEAIWCLLKDATPDIQRIVASKMTTKFVPRLELRDDIGGEYAADIEKLLRSK